MGLSVRNFGGTRPTNGNVSRIRLASDSKRTRWLIEPSMKMGSKFSNSRIGPLHCIFSNLHTNCPDSSMSYFRTAP